MACNSIETSKGLLVLSEQAPKLTAGAGRSYAAETLYLRSWLTLSANKGMYFRIQRLGLVVRRQTCKCWVVWPANQASQVWTGQPVICQKVPILTGHGCSVALLEIGWHNKAGAEDCGTTIYVI